MKKNKLHIIVLCFCIILNLINNEAFANVNKEVDNNSFTIDSLKKNVEVDLRLSYAFFIHHHFEMTGYPKHFPMFELSLQKQTYGNNRM